MKYIENKNLSYLILLLLCPWVMFTSCEYIHEDLMPCERGVSLRFVYDYNMEYANAFPSKVHCLTLYIYDGEGNYVGTRVEKTDVLKDENYRMKIDLEPGDYSMVAYGGVACDDRSFTVIDEPSDAADKLTALSVQMSHNELTSDKLLHDFFYGKLDVTVEENNYKDETVYMMKNTNNIRIILQQMNGMPVSDKDFTFRIVNDDNTLFAHDNSLIENGAVTYMPWAQGQRTVGDGEEGTGKVTVAYAEFSTSRLTVGNHPRLVIANNETDEDVLNIPLNDYLLLLKSDRYADMTDQEYLDRENEWSMIFFLDEDHLWINAQIIINDWVVRLNNITMP
ncbi:FimB/Mfa2 family fimbrial subunit [Phocaeicola barnesiae]